jgi:hypothetical protein
MGKGWPHVTRLYHDSNIEGISRSNALGARSEQLMKAELSQKFMAWAKATELK